ncbi:acyl-CoA dehydratase activase-related protein [Clostridium sp. A1-XYC3]|uniref:Acyl-CoA dehydratase activase-related protein n=1 Tax=Clostridium tanneri TaxID=3037988 RepID=A0ABU4JUZ1_9CLOT|nr:acyl-CoA dehydratase activase-related protein [Clostridium sp. A1-XYC3]MDW8801927.1 acyl-CoA dehydratase activase-related protein [Clostridium sp. A1-XYC3]
MKVGIPKGLLYYKYYPFFETFFTELGAEIIASPDTNKEILDIGVKHSVDEACLPVKVFHGHVASIKDKCDIIFIPRIMQLDTREFICPKFCGLPEMVLNSISDMPKAIIYPIYASTEKELKKWVKTTGKLFTKNLTTIEKAYRSAIDAQKNYKCGIRDNGYNLNVALVGHPYNIYDNFTNMNVVKKLNKLGIGVITEENIDSCIIKNQVKDLFKRPFWTFAKNSYGFSTYLAENRKIDGLVYMSSFSCGIDSVVIELIKDRLGSFPVLILKIDEHTGEAGFDTRLEAFADMLERRCG